MSPATCTQVTSWPEGVRKWALFERPPNFEWGDERVTLLGDACHPMRPFMSQGAAMALEDATVLVDELTGHDDLEAALAAYTTRRRDRAGAVVGNSVQLARWLLEQDPAADVPGLMARTSALLTQHP